MICQYDSWPSVDAAALTSYKVALCTLSSAFFTISAGENILKRSCSLRTRSEADQPCQDRIQAAALHSIQWHTSHSHFARHNWRLVCVLAQVLGRCPRNCHHSDLDSRGGLRDHPRCTRLRQALRTSKEACCLSQFLPPRSVQRSSALRPSSSPPPDVGPRPQ